MFLFTFRYYIFGNFSNRWDISFLGLHLQNGYQIKLQLVVPKKAIGPTPGSVIRSLDYVMFNLFTQVELVNDTTKVMIGRHVTSCYR